jgi:hypothetical protein
MEFADEFFARVNGLSVAENQAASEKEISDPVGEFSLRCELDHFLGGASSPAPIAKAADGDWDTPIDRSPSLSEFNKRSDERLDRVFEKVRMLYGTTRAIEAERACEIAREIRDQARADVIIDLA